MFKHKSNEELKKELEKLKERDRIIREKNKKEIERKNLKKEIFNRKYGKKIKIIKGVSGKLRNKANQIRSDVWEEIEKRKKENKPKYKKTPKHKIKYVYVKERKRVKKNRKIKRRRGTNNNQFGFSPPRFNFPRF